MMKHLVVLYTLAGLSLPAWAQAPPDYQQQPAAADQAPPAVGQAPEAPRWSPEELSNIVAPIALYPDLLLSEVLAASTYPLELTEAQQWMRQNASLRGQQLVEAAKQQNWDPSVQALVAFPDVMNMLTRDIQWTTDLGNAFLSEQAEVMDAIQRLRASARDNGRLTNTPQQRVTTEQENGQSAIVIQPTDPQVVYTPVYNPAYVWGPPVYGAYPPLGYPSPGYGIYYGVGAFLGGSFHRIVKFRRMGLGPQLAEPRPLPERPVFQPLRISWLQRLRFSLRRQLRNSRALGTRSRPPARRALREPGGGRCSICGPLLQHRAFGLCRSQLSLRVCRRQSVGLCGQQPSDASLSRSVG